MRESGWKQLLPGPTTTAPILDSTEVVRANLMNGPKRQLHGLGSDPTPLW